MHFGAEFNYFDAMASAQKSYGKLLEPICQEWKLTRTELNVMLFLYNNPAYDRAADIVSHRGMAKSHVSMSVANMEQRSLLERHFSETDRRTAHLILTETGRQIAQEGRALQDTFFAWLYRDITEEELLLWEKIHEKISSNANCTDRV